MAFSESNWNLFFLCPDDEDWPDPLESQPSGQDVLERLWLTNRHRTHVRSKHRQHFVHSEQRLLSWGHEFDIVLCTEYAVTFLLLANTNY